MTKAWNHLLTSAMLGTERSRWSETELPAEMAAIQFPELDKEDRFLHVAAIMANYRRCGLVPPVKTGYLQAPAPAEEKPYCSIHALRVLNDILEIDSNSLLRLWLAACAEKWHIVPPELVPVLLEKAVKHRHLQTLVTLVCGNRGAWLSNFNRDWQFGVLPEKNVWETGMLQQRLDFLKHQRSMDASAARALLQQVWTTENAATRAELLSALEVALCADDEPWLNELLTDKSIKVRDEALRLLKKLPGSSIVLRYQEVLTTAVFIKKEKGLLGIGSKSLLEVVLPAGSDDLYKTGLEKTSSEKGVADEAHLLYQLVAGVPPRFWETHLQKNPSEIVELFKKHKTAKALVPALVKAAAQFADADWAAVLSQQTGNFYPELLSMLSGVEWQRYALQHLDAHSEHILPAAFGCNTAWSFDLAKAILKHTAKNSYRYQPALYNNIAHLLPIEVIPHLEKCTPSETYLREMWSKTSEHITRLLTLRTQTQNVFATG